MSPPPSNSFRFPSSDGRAALADEYHWANGVGKRKTMLNTHWGGTIDSNEFGTHEFMMLCELLGREPYIAGNVERRNG